MTDITPITPFDDKARRARAEEAEHREGMERVLAKRWAVVDEGRRLVGDAMARGRKPDPLRLDKIHQEARGWEAEYTELDRLRLRASARANALELARERYLLDVHGIFPPRRLYRTGDSQERAEAGPRDAVPGVVGGTARAPVPRAVAGVKSAGAGSTK